MARRRGEEMSWPRTRSGGQRCHDNTCIMASPDLPKESRGVGRTCSTTHPLSASDAASRAVNLYPASQKCPMGTK